MYRMSMTKRDNRGKLESGRQTVTKSDDSVEANLVQVRGLKLKAL